MMRLLNNLLFGESYYYLRLLGFDVCLFIVLQLLSNYIPIVFLLIFIAAFNFILTQNLFSFIMNNLIYGKKNHQLIEFEEKSYKLLFENKLFYEVLIENQLKILKEVKKVDDLLIKNEIEKFIKKFSKTFIQAWYVPYISDNEEFIIESQNQLEIILFDLFKRFSRVNKLSFFRYFACIFDESFINFTECNLTSANIDVNMLHPALHSLPKSEIDHIKYYVQMVLGKSAPQSLHINEFFIEEIFVQIIGKNCFQRLIDIISQPNFLYYSIVLLCNKKFEFNDETSENEDLATQNHSRYNSETDADVKQNERENHKRHISESSMDKISVNSSTFINNENDDNLSIVHSCSESENERSFSSQIDLSVDTAKKINEPNIDLRSLIELIDIKIIETNTDFETKTGDQFTVYVIQV